MESSTLPRAIGVNATVVASEVAGSSHSSGENVERASAEVARAEETAASPMDVEATVGGATSSEPPARQIVPRGKDPIVAPFASPRDLGSSAASIVGRSLEEAMDKMLREYTAQHEGVKSLIQVIALNFPFCISSPPAPKCPVDLATGRSTGDLYFQERLFLVRAQLLVRL